VSFRGEPLYITIRGANPAWNSVTLDGMWLTLADLLNPAGAPDLVTLASPLYADMRGLPPLLILVGTNETLLDDSTRVADKARDPASMWNSRSGTT